MIDWRSDQFSLGVVMSLSTFGFHPYQEGGASPAATVERVAERRVPAKRFLDAATQSGMPFLVRMTAPWPVERFRTPEDLERAWQEASR